MNGTSKTFLASKGHWNLEELTVDEIWKTLSAKTEVKKSTVNAILYKMAMDKKLGRRGKGIYYLPKRK